MKMKLKTMAISLVAITMLAGCGSNTASSTDIPIGIIAPLTGGVSVYGIASSNGTKLAFDELNNANGVSGKKINYTLYDDKGDSTESVNAYNKLASNDKVVAVIGAVTSGPTATMVSAARNDKMPIITPTGTAEELTRDDENMFRACFIDSTQSFVMAEFAKSDLNASTAAVLYNSADDYSTGLANNFKQRFEADGGTIVSFEAYVTEDKDFKTQLTSIKSQEPDVLFLPDYYNTVALIAKQVKDTGITATLLGADGWDGVFSALDDSSKNLLDGAYFCAHYAVDDPDPVVQNFIKSYETTYNQTPNSFAALGYDAGKIMALAIEKAGSQDKVAIVEALKSIDYNGVTGNIKFDSIGNPIKSVAVLAIDNAQATLSKKIVQ